MNFHPAHFSRSTFNGPGALAIGNTFITFLPDLNISSFSPGGYAAQRGIVNNAYGERFRRDVRKSLSCAIGELPFTRARREISEK